MGHHFHLAEEASHVLVHDESHELVAALTIGRPIPKNGKHGGKRGGQKQLVDGLPCHGAVELAALPSREKHEHEHHEARQHHAHGTFGQRGAAHAQHGNPGQPAATSFPPFVQGVERAHDKHCQHHVHAAVGSGAVNLKGREGDYGGKQANVVVLALGIEQRSCAQHDDE